uniref:DC12 family protein putative n=1 Tax=Albugo laibachii Nc14 TaxID=890382 RepID=F0WKE0_9STRA|nr:DC12 family protein putative [Albugo laibachii Nc14]|eukprot:CCA21744.1 DC12 family protein putative [Albugo laibachii Nc14]
MCGRIRCTLTLEEVAKEAQMPSENFIDSEKYKPVENMGPGRFGPVLYRLNNDKRDLRAMRWGLIPSFTKPDAKPDHFIMFNARSESLSERPAFHRLLDKKRCILIANGYYEWQHVGKEKQPYYVHRSSPLKFAGLYDEWTKENGEQIQSFTIITSKSTAKMSWLHDRMPVLLSEEHASDWLSKCAYADVKHVLGESTVQDLDVYPVDKKVGSTKHQEPGLANRIHLTRSENMTKFLLPNHQEIEDSENASTKRKENDPKDTLTSQPKKIKSLRSNRLATRGRKPQQTLDNYFQKKEQSG